MLPLIIVILALGLVIISIRSDSTSESTTSQEDSAKTINEKSVGLEHSLTDPSSPWVIVNKQYSIPTSYTPPLSVPNVRLRLGKAEDQMKIATPAKQAVEKLFQDAEKAGIKYRFGSGYRSAQTQATLYQAYVSEQGQAEADKYSARPGHSEHQTGLAVDLAGLDNYCYLEACWAETPEGKWLADNAHKYGFIIRYLKDKQNITGYLYEPWHLRYVGENLSSKVYNSGKTLEEYFNLPAAPSYQ